MWPKPGGPSILDPSSGTAFIFANIGLGLTFQGERVISPATLPSWRPW